MLQLGEGKPGQRLLNELLAALPDAQAAEVFPQWLAVAHRQRQFGQLLQLATEGPCQHPRLGAFGPQGGQNALGPVHFPLQQGIDQLERGEMGVADDSLLQIGDADGLWRREQGQLLDLLARGKQVALVGVAHEVDGIRQRLEAKALEAGAHPAWKELGLRVVDRHIGADLIELVEPGSLHLGLVETTAAQYQQQVGVELLANVADAGGQILVHLGGQFQFNDLAGGK